MKAASFAQNLVEVIPRTMDQSPCDASISTVEHLDRAGRTPHNKKIEAERNVSLLKKSLQLSTKKPFPNYYDSPASILSADIPKAAQREASDENVHPNASEKSSIANSRKAQFQNLKSPQKFGSAAGNSFSFLTSANDATPQAPTVSWTPFESNTGMRSTPAMPLAAAGYTPAASLPPRARASPPSATSTITAASIMDGSVQPIPVELSSSSPGTQITSIESENLAAPSQCGEGSPNQLWAMLTDADGTVSTQSSPGASVPQSFAAPVNNSADLWALLTNDQSSVQSTPGSVAQMQASPQSAPLAMESRASSPGSVYQQPLTPYHVQVASAQASPASVSMQSAAVSAAPSPVYQQSQTPFSTMSAAAGVKSAPGSVMATAAVSPVYQQPQTPYVVESVVSAKPTPVSSTPAQMSPVYQTLQSQTPYCLEPVAACAKPTPASASAKFVAAQASHTPMVNCTEAALMNSAAKSVITQEHVEEVAVAQETFAKPVVASAQPSPAGSVSSARTMPPVNVAAPSPSLNTILTAHSPATVITAASAKMPTPAAPVLSVQSVKAASPVPAHVPTPAPVQVVAAVSPGVAIEPVSAPMYSPIEHFPYGSSPAGHSEHHDDGDAESIMTESSRGSRSSGTPYAAAPVRVQAPATPEQECNTCNTSMASLSSTSSPAILCRQGGVSLGRGPSSNGYQFAQVKQNLQGKKAGSPVANKTSKLNTSASSNSSGIRSSASRVPVHNIEGSARKPGLPRQDAASKVDRKHLAFIPRPKATAAVTGATPTKAAVRSGVSRSTKRSKQDGVQDTSVSLNVSTATATTSSMISICGVEATSIMTEPQIPMETAEVATSPMECAEAAEPASAVSMHNVSIQCDSFLISGNTTAVNGIASLRKGAPIPNRSSYDCFEEGLDSVLSLDGSQAQSAALDYSIDSPDRQTPPKSLKHTPMFMSYRKIHHDSDSEEDLMMEMGLEELLDHTAVSPQASPIARRHSFEDTCNSAFPFDIGQKNDSTSRTSTAKKDKSQVSAVASKPVAVTVGWEHSFAAPAPAAATPGTLSSRSVTSCSRLTRTASSRKSVLGSAKRVSLQGEVQEQVYYYSVESPDQESVAESSVASEAPMVSGTFPQWHHSMDYTAQEFRNLYETAEEIQLNDHVFGAHLNATAMTDVAVVPANVTALSEHESQVFDLSVSTEEVTCAETTMTLDHKHHLNDSVSQLVDEECGPRLAVMSLKRDNTAAEDIKEIAFSTSPGEVTTVMLTISNHREKSMRMHSHAVSLRFEEYAPGGGLLAPELEGDDHDDALTVETAAPPCSFTVSPAELRLAPGESGTLYVTFTPQASTIGVYSGALKIRSRTKAFVFLLRGKAHKKAKHEASEGIASKQIGIADNEVHELDTSLFKRIKRLNNNSATKAALAPASAPAKVASPVAPSPAASPVAVAQTSPVAVAAVKQASPSPAPAPLASPVVKVQQRALPSLQVNPDTLLLQKSVHGQRYEALLNLQLRNADFTEVSLSASAPFLKLSRTRVIMSTDNEESIKIMLDERSEELLKLCQDILQLDPAAVTIASAGFITVKSATEGEFTIDVSITRSTCFLIRQLHQQRAQQVAQVEKVSPRHPTPSAAVQRASPPSGRSTEQKRPPMPHNATPVLQTPRNNFSAPVSAQNQSVQSRASITSQRAPTPVTQRSAPPASAASRSSRSSTGSKLSCSSDDSVIATAESLLMLRTAPAAYTPQGIASAKRSASAPRSSSGSAGKKLSPAVASIYTASASCDIRNFVRAHSDLPQGYAPVTTTAASASESFVEAFAPQYRAVTEESIQQHNQYHHNQLVMQHKHFSAQQTSLVHTTSQQSQEVHVAHVAQTAHSLVEKKVGVYFRKESINFGAVAIGSLTRANIELCNATDEQVTVYLGDPMLPYVLLHNEISLRPRAYVRVPLRFLPVEEGDYCNEFIAQTADGAYHTRIHLAGSAYA